MNIENCHRCEGTVDIDTDPAACVLYDEHNVTVCIECRRGTYADIINDFPIKQIMFEFLEDLRVSGMVNMFGSAPYLAERFELENEDAQSVLIEWMKTGKH